MQINAKRRADSTGDRSSEEDRYALMLKEAMDLHQRDPVRCLAMMAEVLAHARSVGARSLEARAIMVKGVCHNALSDHATALGELAGALAMFRESGEESSQAVALFNMGVVYNYSGRFTEAIGVLLEALAIQERLGNPGKVRNILYSLGRSYSEMGEFTRAIAILTRSLHLAGEMGDEKGKAGVQAVIANLYGAIREEGGDARLRAAGLLNGVNGRRNMVEGMAYLGIAELNRESGMFEEARRCIDLALDIFREIGAKRGEAVALTMMVGIHLKENNPREAVRCGCEVLAIIETIGEIDHVVSLYHGLGRACIALEDRRQGRLYLERGLAAAVRMNNRPAQSLIEESLAELYEKEGDGARALAHFRSAVSIRSELQTHEVQRTIAELQSRVQLERAEREREVAVLKSSRLELEMGHKERDLSAMALNLKMRDQILASLRAKIDGVLGAPPGRRESLLRDILRGMERPEPVPNTLLAFQREVERSQQEFDRMLSQRFPRLTPTELKVCSLLRGNLSTKDIAELLIVSIRNVETHRYHIRKKLQVPSDTSLATFLISL